MPFLRRDGPTWVMSKAVAIPFELDAVVAWFRHVWPEDNPHVRALRSDPDARVLERNESGVAIFESTWTAKGGLSQYRQEKEELVTLSDGTVRAVFQLGLMETYVPMKGPEQHRYTEATTELSEHLGSTTFARTMRLTEGRFRLTRLPPTTQAYFVRSSTIQDARKCQKELYLGWRPDQEDRA